MTLSSSESEYAIVGGGVVGLSIAFGLLKLGKRVRVFDEGDDALRASRGNFGLVWIQGKGLSQPEYARWSRRSASLWGSHADELQQITDQPLGLLQTGGYSFFSDPALMEEKCLAYDTLKRQLDGDYPFEVLGHNALRKEEPEIGPNITGAILHHEDGHVNPLNLLRSLAEATRVLGADVQVDSRIESIKAGQGGFQLATRRSSYFADKVVLCAGLGSVALADQLGFRAPVRAQRGQVLVTEKLPPLLHRPSLVARQVDEGGIQIGASEEEVGEDDRDTLEIAGLLAKEAIDTFPMLGNVKMIRHWSALRIKSPDGLPIYQASESHPGAFYVTCHSGITLSAAHARLLPLWLTGDSSAPDLTVFGEGRFSV